MSENFEEHITFAIINPDGDLVGSIYNDFVSQAWNEVEDLSWENNNWKDLEAQGYQLIEITSKITQERKVCTRDYL